MPPIPPIVEHILRDLETNHGCLDAMSLRDGPQLQLQGTDGWTRAFELALPTPDGPPILDETQCYYWHESGLFLFGEEIADGVRPLYVRLAVWVGFGVAPHVAVGLHVMDGLGERVRTFVAPRVPDERAWAACRAREWRRALAYADALFAAQVEAHHIEALVVRDAHNNAAAAA